jgi:glycerol uptake facilitator-like aquaporin
VVAVISAQGFVLTVLYAASFVLVVWAVSDVVRRPSSELSPPRKAAWIVGSVVGWFFFGVIGGVIASAYLLGPRRRLNAGRW